MATKPDDTGAYLWRKLLRELEDDEAGLKARLFMQYCFLVEIALNGRSPGDPPRPWEVSKEILRGAQTAAPWNGCKFVSSSICMLVTPASCRAKLRSIRHTSQSLGGLKLPPAHELSRTLLRTTTMSVAFESAVRELLTEREVGDMSAIALPYKVSDVELINHPVTRRGAMRTNTFAHLGVLVISAGGVYVLQGYGKIGYTIWQWMVSCADLRAGPHPHCRNHVGLPAPELYDWPLQCRSERGLGVYGRRRPSCARAYAARQPV
mmetsp:Transcript_16520/g.38121  ORF Transcript_16520/g.38121 Transcript_16520/m.38121 type:complete len:264 (-) Transcript_16520:539-1330(-)